MEVSSLVPLPDLYFFFSCFVSYLFFEIVIVFQLQRRGWVSWWIRPWESQNLFLCYYVNWHSKRWQSHRPIYEVSSRWLLTYSTTQLEEKEQIFFSLVEIYTPLLPEQSFVSINACCGLQFCSSAFINFCIIFVVWILWLLIQDFLGSYIYIYIYIV